jgi:hypothetical protein
LAKGYPNQQDNGAGNHDDPPDAKAPGDVDALGKNCPGVNTEPGAQHHGGCETKEEQA